MTHREHIAFFGLGTMGEPMAEKIAQSGKFVLHVWNRSAAKAENFQQKYKDVVVVARTPKEAVESSNRYLLTMLFDYEAIKDTLFSSQSISLEDKVLIQLATVSVEQSKDLDERTRKAGGIFVESPVLGSNKVAQEGKLQVLLGCSKDIFQQIEQTGVLNPLGDLFHIGEKPKATHIKLCLNFLVGSLTSSLATALALVQKNDLDVQQFLQIVQNSQFYFKYIDVKAPRMISHDYSNANFTLDGLLKDFIFIEQQAQDSGVNTLLVHTIRQLLEQTKEKSGGDLDFAAVYELMNSSENKKE
jgi:3-hydroxyisobutyrate dehydrogenase